MGGGRLTPQGSPPPPPSPSTDIAKGSGIVPLCLSWLPIHGPRAKPARAVPQWASELKQSGASRAV
jgi:hypothetical protein